MRIRVAIASWTLLPWVLAAEAAEGPGGPGRDLPDVVGVTHVAGKYHLTEKDFLNEGADQILALGSRVVKLYLTNPAANYPFHADWPRASSLVEIARTPLYRAVFEKPFTTYILTAYAVGRGDYYWRSGVSEEAREDEIRQFRELAKHLLETYRGTGKTFVLQHWEGDWAIRGSFDRKAALEPLAVRGMIDWLRARQEGVERARREVAETDVRVYHALEVNLVVQAMREDLPGVVERVLPESRVDLVSYSAWDAQQDPATLEAALERIERHLPEAPPAPRSFPFRRRVYIGEFGAPENDFSPERVRKTVEGTVETGLRWGCPWVVYWQVYCNEARRRPVVRNEDVRGFCLLRPDGTRTWAWGYLQGLLGGAEGAPPETSPAPPGASSGAQQSPDRP